MDKKTVNNLRVLAVQMVENANSGHPGIALGATPILYSLFAKHAKISNLSKTNILRDRVVLSAGHGSAMLYSFLHAFDFGLTTDDLKKFRSINSNTPGHPEYDLKYGIESTTGPLGQGVANAVGMALAEQYMASVFNKPDYELINNHTFALVGDGCLMEGVANEALSLAGTLNLNKLIVLYDFNKITIDGRIDVTFMQNTKKVFMGYGFNVIEVKDGNNLKEINLAIGRAKKSTKPTLVIVNSIIGFGSVLADTEKAHGAPLGKENVKLLQEKLGIKTEYFELEEDVKKHLKGLIKKQVNNAKEFSERLNGYKLKYPKDYEKLQKYLKTDFSDLNDLLKDVKNDKNMLSTRDAGGEILNIIANKYENIIGGTADLSSSTKTIIKSSGQYPNGRNIMFGVREFGMSAITNGIALYGGLVPFNSTFFVFSDYMKAGIRLSSLMNLKVQYIFTHDSIGVGEDGPTHQSVEQLATFRAMPNTTLFRPANFEETKAAYISAYNGQNTLIILTRQNILNFESDYKDALKGGYILRKETKKPEAIILATGSEVQIALSAYEKLNEEGVSVRVVSMPSFEIFEKQSESYKDKIIPKGFKNIVAIEAGSALSWYKYTGKEGKILSVDSFGKSGKHEDIYMDFGLTDTNLIKTIKDMLGK